MFFGKNHVHVMSLGLAFGVCLALYVFFIGILSWQFQWGVNLVSLLGEWYLGFGPSLLGSMVGAVWGFVDGFVGGVILAWLYNFFREKLE